MVSQGQSYDSQIRSHSTNASQAGKCRSIGLARACGGSTSPPFGEMLARRGKGWVNRKDAASIGASGSMSGFCLRSSLCPSHPGWGCCRRLQEGEVGGMLQPPPQLDTVHWQHAQRLAVCTATGNMHSDWQHAIYSKRPLSGVQWWGVGADRHGYANSASLQITNGGRLEGVTITRGGSNCSLRIEVVSLNLWDSQPAWAQ